MPTTLVCTKGPGPSIERSTWVSAARCITASGWWVANTCAIAAASVMSARTSVWRGLVRAVLQRVLRGGVGHLVDVHDAGVAVAQQVADHGRADEAAPAGQQNAHSVCPVQNRDRECRELPAQSAIRGRMGQHRCWPVGFIRPVGWLQPTTVRAVGGLKPTLRLPGRLHETAAILAWPPLQPGRRAHQAADGGVDPGDLRHVARPSPAAP